MAISNKFERVTHSENKPKQKRPERSYEHTINFINRIQKQEHSMEEKESMSDDKGIKAVKNYFDKIKPNDGRELLTHQEHLDRIGSQYSEGTLGESFKVYLNGQHVGRITILVTEEILIEHPKIVTTPFKAFFAKHGIEIHDEFDYFTYSEKLSQQEQRTKEINAMFQKHDSTFMAIPAGAFSKSQESYDVYKAGIKVGTIFGTDGSIDFFFRRITEEDIKKFIETNK